jgi:GxxExxY protein
MSMRREPDTFVDEVARRVIGAAIEVHRVLGPGFLESVYEAAFCIELEQRGIRFARQVTCPVPYKGVDAATMRIDLLVEDCLIVELKCVDELGPMHRAQAIAYLRATKLQLALLINFRTVLLRYGIRRVVSTTDETANDQASELNPKNSRASLA